MYFYLHVPRTGGQTLAKRLASAFRPEDVHTFQDTLVFPRDVAKLAELKKTKKFVGSHVTDILLKDVDDLDIMATVRDPVEQTISNWRHIRRQPASPLNRAALTLRPREFFDNFFDYFMDMQSSYVLSCFSSVRLEEARVGHLAAFTRALAPALDRIRWLTPTESIDEFVPLWSLEVGLWAPNDNETVNRSPDGDAANVEEAREHLLKRKEWFRVDYVLHDVAIERHAAYRRHVLRPRNPYRDGNSRLGYLAGFQHIWLVENWYDPVPTAQGLAWWAGPTRAGRIHVRRAPQNRFLFLDVIAVNGVTADSIAIKDPKTLLTLPTTRTKKEGGVSFCVDLDGMESEQDLVVMAPECMAWIMTTSDHDDLTRRSFAAANWRLSSEPSVD